MGGNSEASVPESSGTKKDDGSRTDKQKPTGPCQNDSQGHLQCQDVVPGKTTGVPSESDTDSTATPSETERSHEKRKRDETPSEGTAQNLFGRKIKTSSPEQKVSNANDAASQKSHDQRKTNDFKDHFARHNDPPSGSAPDQTPQSCESSTTVEHSSETNTGTGRLQSKTISEDNKSSPSGIFGRRNK